jgi:hypothetical protein
MGVIANDVMKPQRAVSVPTSPSLRMACAAVVAAGLLLAAREAAAGKPSVAEIEKRVKELPNNWATATSLVAAPFVHGQLTFSSDFNEIEKPKAEQCQKVYGPSGTVTSADLSGFIECMRMINNLDVYTTTAPDTKPDWHTVNAAKLPTYMQKYKVQIGELAKTHTVVIAHLNDIGLYEVWNVWAASKDASGAIHLDAVFTAWVRYDDERTKKVAEHS